MGANLSLFVGLLVGFNILNPCKPAGLKDIKPLHFIRLHPHPVH